MSELPIGLIMTIGSHFIKSQVSLEAQKRVDQLVRAMPPLNRTLKGSRRDDKRGPVTCNLLSPIEGTYVPSNNGAADVYVEWRVKGVWVPEEASVVVLINQHVVPWSGGGGLGSFTIGELGSGDYHITVQVVGVGRGEVLASSGVRFSVD
jgi:hypothetical protein